MPTDQLPEVRRIVTGHTADGKSCFISDAPTPHKLENPNRPGRGLVDFWRTDRTPASNEGNDDAAAVQVQLLPPKNGSVFRYFQIMPDKLDADLSQEERMRRDAELFAKMGAAREHDAASGRPGMHKTDTVDYIILLKGEVTLILDEGEVDMRPFDVVIERGTNHAWLNKGDEPALLAGVLIDAEPI
jgi:hypothetical protein